MVVYGEMTHGTSNGNTWQPTIGDTWHIIIGDTRHILIGYMWQIIDLLGDDMWQHLDG